jgi:hypothetical protein
VNPFKSPRISTTGGSGVILTTGRVVLVLRWRVDARR